MPLYKELCEGECLAGAGAGAGLGVEAGQGAVTSEWGAELCGMFTRL